MPRRPVRSAAIALALLAPIVVAATRPALSPAPHQAGWLRELTALEAFAATKYANFDWKVRHGVDPVALHIRTESRLRQAGSARQARAALVDFVEAFHDGHFVARPLPRATDRESASRRTTGTSDDGTGPARDTPARTICRTFGYRSESSRTAFTRLAGWRAVQVPRLPFTAGIIEREGRRDAILRIHSFGHEPHGWACELAWPAVQLRITGERCAAACESALRRAVADTLASALAEAVRTLAREQPAALVIDLTGNGGGTEWVTLASRAITARPLPPLRVAYIRNDFHRARLGPTPENAPCDRSAVWSEGVRALSCGGLISGLVAEAPARDATVTAGWSGRIVLVTDGASASATEQFAAELADGADAWVVGARTHGSGCGYTEGAEHLDLPAVGLRIHAPDCARFRRDGTNEVDGITPTHDAGWTAGDGAVARAEKVVSLLQRARQARVPSTP